METLQHCWWQILVAGLAYFVFGAIWYNQKVLGTLWQKSHNINFTDEQKKAGMNPMHLFLTFLCTLAITTVICYFCYNISNNMGGSCSADGCCTRGGLWFCAKIGLLIGLTASAATSMGYINQMKPRSAFLVDCGYHVFGSLLAAVVLHFTCCF